MAQGTTLLGGKVIVLLGDGANPENFTAALGGVTKTFARTAKTNDFVVPDNSDPDVAVYTDRVAASLDWSLSVDGYLESENIDAWDTFFELSSSVGGASKNVHVRFTAPAAIAGRTYQGAAICTKIEFKGENSKKVMVSVTIAGTGALTRTIT